MTALRWLSAVALVATTTAAFGTAEPAAQALVRDTTTRVIEALRKEKDGIATDPHRLYLLVDDIILPHFDFERMSQRVLGKHWRQATPEQRQQFVAQFQRLLVRTYATALAEYRDQTINFLAPRPSAEAGEITIRTEVTQSGGPPIPISYDMYQAGSEWKVFDVAIDGISLVINYRSTFGTEVRQNGIEGLIDRLAKHNQGVAR